MKTKDKIIHELTYSAAGRFSACETQADYDTQTRLYAALLTERIDDLIGAALQAQPRLERAAPDLLAACENEIKSVDLILGDSEEPDWLKRIRIAVAKAKGD